MDGKGLLYKISSKQRWRGGRLVRSDAVMKAPRGSHLMRRQARWSGAEKWFPVLRVQHPHLGREISARRVKGGFELRRKEGRDEAWQRKVLQIPEPAVNGGGLPLLLAARRGELQANRVVRFSMAAPSRLEWYRFRARSLGKVTRGGRELLKVEIEPDSLVVRAFAGEMRFFIDVQTGAMSGYEGIVAVRDDDGDRLKARVRFKVINSASTSP